MVDGKILAVWQDVHLTVAQAILQQGDLASLLRALNRRAASPVAIERVQLILLDLASGRVRLHVPGDSFNGRAASDPPVFGSGTD